MRVYQTVRKGSYVEYTFSIVVEDNPSMLGTKLVPGSSKPRQWHACYHGTDVNPRDEALVYSIPWE